MMPIVRLGSLGDAVKALQEVLNLWSGSDRCRLVVDGFFGLATNRRVREYQSTYELAPDGVVGAATWESLQPLLDYLLATGAPVSERAAIPRIVLAYTRTAAATTVPARPKAARRAWTSSPSARRDAARRTARSA